MARRLWIVLSLMVMTMSVANAGPRLLEEAGAPPLPAWVKFCDQLPAECAIDVLQPETVSLTHEIYTLLSSVNLAVNNTLKPMTDQAHYGVMDLWSYPSDGIGDCEDYQLLKRRLLIKAGLPRRALLMTVVLDENGEGHAVLTIRTDRGDLVLDNKTDDVVEWFRTNYTFVKRESAREAKWVYLTAEATGTLMASASAK